MFRKRNPAAGAPPGTLVFRKNSVPARVQIVRYSADRFEYNPRAVLDDIFEPIRDGETLWVDVAGVDDPDVLRAGGKRFGLSDLVMEDIVNVPQRPKTELVGGKILSIAHILHMCDEGELDIDQLSVVLGSNFAITVHSQAGDYFQALRTRLENPNSRLRNSGPDYLAYTVLDRVVDDYYPVLESLGERLETLEDDALNGSGADVLRDIHRLRSQLIQVRRSSWPMRDAMDFWLSAETPLVAATTKDFLRDTRSHCAQTVDVVEMYRESAAALVSTYMSAVAHRSNEIMKVLALVSSIFVPMSFISGVYGMNFENMPELNNPWSYPIALIVMAGIASSMLLMFFRRGWLGATSLRSSSTRDELTIRTNQRADIEVYARPSVSSSPDKANPLHETTRPRRRAA